MLASETEEIKQEVEAKRKSMALKINHVDWSDTDRVDKDEITRRDMLCDKQR